MKFLLLRCVEENVQPYVKSPSYVPSLYPPLGLMYIGSALENDGHSVELIDLGLEKISKEHLKNSLINADAVGMNTYTNSYKYVADLSQKIREFDSDIPIIIGGPHCIFVKEQSLYDIHNADIAVAGEGEQIIIDIVRYLQGKKNLSDINGIYYRENGIIKSGKPLKIVDDIDSLCFPARHLVDKYDYGVLPLGYKVKKKFTFMLTSRGCQFHCRFCARYGNIIKGYGVRKRSTDNIMKEIYEINENYNSVAIVDDNFLADIKRSHIIFDMILASDVDLEFLIMGARVDTADRVLYRKMKKAGVKYIGYGIESGNQDVLDFYNKGITLNQIRKAVTLGNEMGFFTVSSFILGAPIETKKHIKKTIKFACSLPLDIALFGKLQYEMGSPLWVEAVKNKKIAKDEYLVPSDSRRDLWNFTSEELYGYVQQAFRRFYLRPNYVLCQISKCISRKDFSIVINGLKVITSIYKN